jgi:hypothetical protein
MGGGMIAERAGNTRVTASGGHGQLAREKRHGSARHVDRVSHRDSAESFQEPQRQSCRGKALVILRTTKDTVEGVSTVSSAGRWPVELMVSVE